MRVAGNIQANYVKQQSEPPFPSLVEFLSWGDMNRYTNTTMRDFFKSRGVSTELIEAALVPLNRAIYNQGSLANAFGLFASLTAELGHHSVKQGNSELVKSLFKMAGATVKLNATVSEVSLRAAQARQIPCLFYFS